jgi:hypothetical protein
MLQKFQNITLLVLEDMENHKIDNTVHLDLPNLTHLQIDSGYWLLSRIRTHNVKVLHFSLYGSGALSVLQLKNFQTFMKTCNGLKHLIFKGFFPKAIAEYTMSSLEALDIFNANLSTDFHAFAMNHKSSLRNLTITKVSDNDDRRDIPRESEISKLVYFNMSLEKIVDLRSYHGEIKEVTPMKSLKNLTMLFPSHKKEEFLFFERLIPCCIAVEILNINLPSSKELEALRIISTLPKLKHLVLQTIDADATEEIQPTFKIEQIEKLTIFDRVSRVYIDLICGCPNIIKLEIINPYYDCRITAQDFERITESCTKLWKITLVGNFQVKEEDFEILDSVSLRLNLKIEVRHNEMREKLKNLKNHLTVMERSWHYDYEEENKDNYTIDRESKLPGFNNFYYMDDESESEDTSTSEDDTDDEESDLPFMEMIAMWNEY